MRGGITIGLAPPDLNTPQMWPFLGQTFEIVTKETNASGKFVFWARDRDAPEASYQGEQECSTVVAKAQPSKSRTLTHAPNLGE